MYKAVLLKANIRFKKNVKFLQKPFYFYNAFHDFGHIGACNGFETSVLYRRHELKKIKESYINPWKLIIRCSTTFLYFYLTYLDGYVFSMFKWRPLFLILKIRSMHFKGRLAFKIVVWSWRFMITSKWILFFWVNLYYDGSWNPV